MSTSDRYTPARVLEILTGDVNTVPVEEQLDCEIALFKLPDKMREVAFLYRDGHSMAEALRVLEIKARPTPYLAELQITLANLMNGGIDG